MVDRTALLERDASLEGRDLSVDVRQLDAGVGPLLQHAWANRVAASHLVKLAPQSVPLRSQPGPVDVEVGELRLKSIQTYILNGDRRGGSRGGRSPRRGWPLGWLVHGMSG